MKPTTSFADSRTLGIHHLGVCGNIADNEQGRQKLHSAAKLATQVGARIFELVCPPFCQLPADTVAGILRQHGITTIAYCVVFTETKASGGEMYAPYGDPISTVEEEIARATQVFRQHLTYIQLLAEHGVNVMWITGPSCFVLGRDYSGQTSLLGGGLQRNRTQLDWDIAKFYSQFADELLRLDTKVCIEYLRIEEDRGALESVESVLSVINQLDGVNGPFRVHFDVFHTLKRGHDPVESILKAGDLLGYVHAHGPDRISPGTWLIADQPGETDSRDSVNWWNIGNSLDQVQFSGPIVPEPFCLDARRDIPVLGIGLPPAQDPLDYYRQADRHLRRVGIIE